MRAAKHLDLDTCWAACAAWGCRLASRMLVGLWSLAAGFAHALAPSEAAYSRAWLNILHLSRAWDGTWNSGISDGRFFFASQGPLDPKAEWQAAEALFTKSYAGPPDQHPRCLYPARAAVFDRLSGLEPAPLSCPSLSAFRSTLDAASATIVHAAQHIEAPASMFGHIFLRFNRASSRGNGLRLDTLAFSTGYFAITPVDVSPFDYASKGLAGGYTGRFLPSTYAKSLLEYGRIESRELLEYDLRLSPSAMRLLVDHLWELLHSGHSAYRFLRENCAYQLLALVQAVTDGPDLTGSFALYVVPSDAIASLEQAGLTAAGRHRNSQRSRARLATQRLNQPQWSSMNAVLQGHMDPDSVADAEVLDAAYEVLEYRKYQQADEPSATKDIEERQRRVLLARAPLPSTAAPPEEGPGRARYLQGPARLTLAYARQQESADGIIGFRPAMHDSLDRNPAGSGIALTIFDIQLAVRLPKYRPRVHQLTLLNIENLRGLDRLDYGLAWRLKLGWQPDIWGAPSSTANFSVWPAVGIASAPERPVQVYALTATPVQSLDQDPRHSSLGISGTLGARLVEGDSLRAYAEITRIYITSIAPHWRTSLKSAALLHLAPQLALGLGAVTDTRGKQRYELSAHHYF